MDERKRILVIDDEPDIRSVLSRRLTANGFGVLEAGSGPTGIALAKEVRPDLILLDVMMPGQDGIETYHALKQASLTKKIPVIFLTVLAEKISLTKHGLELEDSYAILGKPYQANELLQEVRRALGESVVEKKAD